MAPIFNPNGTEVAEVILPDGATASEVLAPDGSTVLSGIPDSVVSALDDNTSFSGSDKVGFEIHTKTEWPSIGARISSMTSGATRAYLTDDGATTTIQAVDVSGLSAGDAFTFDNVDLAANTDYWIFLDAEGSSWTIGFNNNNNSSYPFTSPDVDIVAGVFNDSAGTGNGGGGVNDIGDTGF